VPIDARVAAACAHELDDLTRVLEDERRPVPARAVARAEQLISAPSSPLHPSQPPRLQEAREVLRSVLHDMERAALRRVPQAPEPVVRLDDLAVDLDAQLVTRDGEPVSLTRTEFLLLRFMIENRGKLLTHRMILQKVWGPSYQVESHYLHVYVSRLRQKLEADPVHPRHLLTEPGAGYRLI
jgi:hypothetical protein